MRITMRCLGKRGLLLLALQSVTRIKPGRKHLHLPQLRRPPWICALPFCPRTMISVATLFSQARMPSFGHLCVA